MAYYAFLDSNNVVIEVIPGKDETDTSYDWEEWYGNFRGQPCKRTSYNTYANTHRLNGTPYRKNFGQIGFTYDASRDAFIPPKPYASWSLNEDTCLWQAPITRPEPWQAYVWNEDALSWDLTYEYDETIQDWKRITT
jgi:hypothetical protein